ncbi:MAG: hypothetical protein ABI451_10020 [Dokdonella sp.]
MRANHLFAVQPKEFWANVRTISEEVGYTKRGNKKKRIPSIIKLPTLEEVKEGFSRLNLTTTHIANGDGTLTDFGRLLFEYFAYRADVLNKQVQVLLMDKNSAEAEFKSLKKRLKPSRSLPT